MNNDDFAVFILSHGRSDNVLTYKTLRKSGYTGRIYIIVDDEDTQIEQYVSNFGKENVVVFDKKKYKGKSDSRDNFPERNTVLYARNACFDIAKKVGVRFFLELDDDYIDFRHRFLDNVFSSGHSTRQFDRVVNIYITFLKQTPFTTISFAQGGDFIGGINGEAKKIFIKRKSMNSFFCDIEKPFMFQGRMNDDVNTYVSLGKVGRLFGQPNVFMLDQEETQKNAGGLTDMYLKYGTYVKSMYTAIDCPSCIKVTMMGVVYPRLHHRITWKYAVPKILNERYRRTE